MIQVTGSEEESLRKNNPVIHYRFKRKIEYLNCHTQMYMVEDKIKIVINCIEEYSDDYKEYSNIFSLYQLQEINKYFNFFEKMEDVLEDMANIFQHNSYDIEKNTNSLILIIHVLINNDFGNVHLTLFRNRPINKHTHKVPSQIIQNIKNNDNRKKTPRKPYKNNIENDNSRMVVNNSPIGVKSVKELNNLLTDLKDRITVLEVNQNMNQNQNKQFIKNNNYYNNLTYPEKVLSLGSTSLAGNENILLSMDSILKRINRLEEANTQKKQKIKDLKEKLRVYEPMLTTSENDSIYDNKAYNFNDNNNINNIYNNNEYINLGSIKNKDMNTDYSNNTYKKNNLLEIKEEEVNSSSSSKNKKKRKNYKYL